MDEISTRKKSDSKKKIKETTVTTTTSSVNDTSISDLEKKKNKKKKEKEDTSYVIEEDDLLEITPLRINGVHCPPPNSGLHIVASVTFFDGYTFRQFFEFLKQSVQSSPLYFSKRGILIDKGNELGTFNCETFFDKDQLTEYFVDENHWNSPDNKCHIVNINFKKLFVFVKKISKKESFCLCMYREKPFEIFVSCFGGTNKGNAYIGADNYLDTLKYEIEDGFSKTDEPNIKIPLCEFSNACKEAGSLNSDHCFIKCTENGLKIICNDILKESGKDYSWGDTDTKNNTKTYYTTKVKTSVLKGLNKLINFNSRGVISIYCKMNGIIRAETTLGTFGTSTLHIIENGKYSCE